MKYTFLVLVAVAFFSCHGDDDDYGAPLNYTICVDELLAESERIDSEVLAVKDWSSVIRTYISAEFSGYSISSMINYKDSTAQLYTLVILDNQGQLLFDETGSFVCGDSSFKSASGDDDYINIEDLPQSIKDYIATNYPNRTIKKAEFEDGAYEVELDDGTELCFDQNGLFIGEC